jgi:hypothetical protein
MSSIAAADANRTAVVGSDVAAAEVSPNRYVTNRPNALFSDDLSAIARRAPIPTIRRSLRQPSRFLSPTTCERVK